MNDDVGGDAPCWAHLLDGDEPSDPFGREPRSATIVDLGATDTRGRGAVWSLPHGGDLDANLVHLDPGDAIDAHVNAEVDVALLVIAGSGTITIEGHAATIGRDSFAVVPKGTCREVRASTGGITYLSIHRSRGGLTLGATRRGSSEAAPDE